MAPPNAYNSLVKLVRKEGRGVEAGPSRKDVEAGSRRRGIDTVEEANLSLSDLASDLPGWNVYNSQKIKNGYV